MTSVLQNLLQRELAERCRRNPAYSLRAFAKAVGISPAYLSRLMSGQRQASADILSGLAKSLGLSPQEYSRLSPTEPRELEGAVSPENIDALYEDWVGMAILEMITLSDFEADETWIATRLGVSLHRVRQQKIALLNLGFLSITDDGQWINCYGEMSLVRREATSLVRRSLLRQRLELASQAVDEVSFERRDHSFVTLAMDESTLAEARTILRTCRRDLLKLGASAATKNSIFHLDLALYPVTNAAARTSLPNTKQRKNTLKGEQQ